MPSPTKTLVVVHNVDNGRLVSGPVIGYLSPDKKVTMTCVAPSLIPLTFPEKQDVYEITKTAEQIQEPGGNIFLRFAERLGHGRIRVHTLGLIQVNYCFWWYWKAEIEVQYYRAGNKLFTCALLHQKDLEETLKQLIQNDEGIPPYSEHTETVAEPCTIKWFDPFRLIGAIASADPAEDVYFHWNNFGKQKPYIGFLKYGTKVNYQAQEDTGSFRLKASSVRLV